MKLSTINIKSIKDVSNQELISLHKRIHKLYAHVKAKGKEIHSKILSGLLKIHRILVNEMKLRKLDPKSFLDNSNLV